MIEAVKIYTLFSWINFIKQKEKILLESLIKHFLLYLFLQLTVLRRNAEKTQTIFEKKTKHNQSNAKYFFQVYDR